MGGVRFSPGKFKYNGRVATSLIPSLVVLAGFGGSIPVGVALVGAMVSYMLDAMRFREGALLAVWLTLGVVNLSFWLTGAVFYIHEHVGLSLLIAVCIGTTLFTTGIWATLQFKWVQMQYPVVVLAFEKMLLATAFTVSAMVQSWGLVAAVGASQAPFYLVPVLCALYYLLALPLTSSFHVKGARDSAIGGTLSKELQVQADIEGVAATLLLVVLPASLYAVLHSSMLAEWVHLWSLLLLASLPVLFLSIVENGLWWLPGGQHRRLAARRALCLGALGVALGGLEGRLIFPAFGQYIQIPAPWNYAAVTVALYGTTALAVAFLGGLLSEETGSMLTSSALLLSAGLGAVAAGMPLLYLAAPLVGAGGLALFLQSRKFADYCIFVMGGVFTAAWFIHHHFWFLEVDIAGLSLQRLCVTLWVGIAAALMIPGMAISKAAPEILSALFLFKAVIIAEAEKQLYLGAGEVQGEMYPAIMVIGTSVLGVATTHRLKSEKVLGHWTAWLVFSIFASKLVLLILPQERTMWPAFLLASAVTAPVLGYHTAALSQKGVGGRLQPWQGLLHATAVVFATLVARFSIYDILRLVLGSRPSEGLLLGVLVLVGVGGCVPLFVAHYSKWREGKRLLVMAATCGILFVLLRPPLPLQGGAVCPGWLPTVLCFRLWDEAHRPEHELDDVAVWGEYGERRDRWPSWMLVGAAVTALTAATARFPASDSATKGLGYAALSGSCVGAYIALEFFPGQSALQVVVFVATLAVAGVLVGLRLRGVASPALIGLLLFAWTSGLPIGLAIQAVVALPVLPQDARRLFGDADILIDHQRQESNRAALLAVYSAEALLLAFAVKLRVSAARSAAAPSLPDAGTRAAAVVRASNAYAKQAATFLGQCLPTASLAARRPGSLTGAVEGAAQLSSEGLEWLPTAGNVITLGCLASSLVLNSHLTQASDLAIFVLSPMLVLLNQDSWFPALHARRRYFPSAVAVSAYLAASALVQAFTAWATPDTVATRHGSSTVALMKNLWLAAAALPCHVHFSQYLWTQKRIEGSSLLLMAPLNVAVLLFSDLLVVRLLAGTAMLMAAVQYAAMRHVRHEGMLLI